MDTVLILRRASTCAAAVALAIPGVAILVSPATASGTSTPSSPTPASNSFNSACATIGRGASGQGGCITAALKAFDAVRRGEHVGAMSLPTNFATESVPVQLFVLANVERVDRGLGPFSAMSPQLNARSLSAARADQDPTFASPLPGTAAHSNWSAKGNSALLDTFDWMYDDSINAGNYNCDHVGESGCWIHRHGILGVPAQYSARRLMGAAVAYNTAEGTSMTEEFIGGDHGDSAGHVTWTPLAKKIPLGVSAHTLSLSNGSGHLKVWASGRTMRVTGSVSGGGGRCSVSAHSFTLKAGHSRTLSVTCPSGATVDGASLILHDGDHTTTVTLTA
jgi:hypothetical protein